MTESSIAKLLKDGTFNPNLTIILTYLLEENETLKEKVEELTSDVQKLRIKTNELERYQSKDCIIISNLPIGYRNSYVGDVMLFLEQILKVKVSSNEIKACHPLSTFQNYSNPPAVIVKFVSFETKNSIYQRKKLLKNFRNPRNGKLVYINERLSKQDTLLKLEAEKRNMLVSTWNSAPFVKIPDEMGYSKDIRLDTEKDINDLEATAVKKKTFSSEIAPVNSTTAGTSVNNDAYLRKNKKRTRSEVFQLSPTPTRDDDTLTTLTKELSARLENSSDLADFVKGFLGNVNTHNQSSFTK